MSVAPPPLIPIRERNNELSDDVAGYSTAAAAGHHQIESSRRDAKDDEDDAYMHRLKRSSAVCKYPFVVLVVTSSITITSYSISTSTRTTTFTLGGCVPSGVTICGSK